MTAALRDLADEIDAKPSTVSQHLTRLVRAGLVHRWKVGKTAQYRAGDTSNVREEQP